jgi:hypothetical protein
LEDSHPASSISGTTSAAANRIAPPRLRIVMVYFSPPPVVLWPYAILPLLPSCHFPQDVQI